MTPAYRVYVLQNPAGRFYIGVTGDVAKRLGQHNAGASRWTRGKGPWHLVWESELLPLSAARKIENRLKRQGRGKGFYSITALHRPTGS
jgi:putative endonuclease